MLHDDFTLDDFKKALGHLKTLGPLDKVMRMIPGMDPMDDVLKNVDAERDMRRLHGIIDAMTIAERAAPSKTINPSRCRRIAAGAGVELHEVHDLVKHFDGFAELMKSIRRRSL